MTNPFYTVGHSNRSVEELAGLLRQAGVGMIADIRTVPRSRANPQFNADVLGGSLASWQIGYEPIPALGGLRGRSAEVPPEVNGWWDNKSFHNYADHALSQEFREGLERLIALGRERPTAMMCAEGVWWRCHRRIVADHLIARGEAVLHLMGGGRVEPARLSEGARVEDGTVTYPPPLL